MAQLLVRNLDEDVKLRLQQRAADHGRSMEEEVRVILQAAADQDVPATKAVGLGTRIAARFTGHGLSDDIAELRGCVAAPAIFDAA